MKNINITYVDQKRLSKTDNKKVNRNNPFKNLIVKIVLLGTAVAGIVTSFGGCNKKVEAPQIIPEQCVQIFVRDDIEYGDTLTAIAGEYYDPEVYDSYYGSIGNYIDSIADTNNIRNKNHITPYQTLTIPVFVDEENIYLKQISELEEQIKQLPRWVKYEVQYGDTILGLAYKGAGTTNEAYSIRDDILSRNNLKNSILRAGSTIEIVNPEIGELKAEIARLTESLYESAKIEQETSKSR